MSSTFPPKGQMVLYSSATPPLQDGSYRLTVETDVTYGAANETADNGAVLAADAAPGPLSQQHYFDVVGPRFTVPAAMVAGCSPPRNAHGAFQDSLPHIVLGRRTLPWERALAPASAIPSAPNGPRDAPALTDPYPWVALLLFEEGEYTLLRNIPLEQAVPAGVFAALGRPANITCDAVEADAALIASIMPTYQELQLLVHVRQVNTDDRELNAFGGDGFFSVVVANRLPSPNAQCRAVLVSLEQRVDVIPKDTDPQFEIPVAVNRGVLAGSAVDVLAANRAANVSGAATPFTLSKAPVHTFDRGTLERTRFPIDYRVRLVALTSWQFTCEGPGTFRELMQGLDDQMFGTVAQPGQPPLTDTGHMPITLQDRAGEPESVLYRGPLVQNPLTRDALGPYHSADQARRVAPESGTEDVSYACAFEAGRLLAAADGRLAQALMRWRRESYKQSARADTINAAAARVPLGLPATLAERLHSPIVPRVTAAASVAVAAAKPLPGDPYGLGMVAATSTGVIPGTLGAPVTAPQQTARANTTLAAVAADAGGLARLDAARTQAIENAKALSGDS